MNPRLQLLLGVVALPSAAALDNGLGLTPQMGYNSWYDLMCSASMNETTIQATADALVLTGLAGVGYTYVNLDDCYIKSRSADGVEKGAVQGKGTLLPDPATFPSGMRALGDYIHAVSPCIRPDALPTCNHSATAGLMFGVYTDRGPKTCAMRPAAEGHEAQDAMTYANWTADYVKEDSCNAPTDHAAALAQYGLMSKSLNATGRPMFFSLCGWNAWYAEAATAQIANSWRIGPDDSNWPGIIKNIDIMAGLAAFAGPKRGWNDPCLLLSVDWTGKQLVTERQSRAQMSLWAVMAAPLLISGSVLRMTNYTLETYLNKDVISVNQDPLGIQGKRIAGVALAGCKSDCTNIWSRPLKGNGNPGTNAVVFLNTGKATADIHCDHACWAAAGYSAADFPLEATDMWGGPWERIEAPDYTANAVEMEGGVRMLKVQKIPDVSKFHLKLPHCTDGDAIASPFHADWLPPPSVPAVMPTTVKLCWDAFGLHFKGNATDDNIYNSATNCNDPTFSMGDVMEVFVSPVAKISDTPTTYLELDTAAVSGALWGMLASNDVRPGPNKHQGLNVGGDTETLSCDKLSAPDTCTSTGNSSGTPCDLGSALAACMFSCTGANTFVHGMTTSVSQGAGWWADHLKVPWAMFPSEVPKQSDMPMYKFLRLNLYRYDYNNDGPLPSGTADPNCKGEFSIGNDEIMQKLPLKSVIFIQKVLFI